MSASWTRAQLRAAEAAWASWQILLADEFDNNDDGLLAAIEARSGITQAELYHQRIEADRSAGVFRALADPGKASPPVRPVAPAAVWRLDSFGCPDGPVTVLRDPDGTPTAFAVGAAGTRLETVVRRLNGSAWLAVGDAL